MHGHSRNLTHVLLALALMGAIAVFVVVPSPRSLSAAGAVFLLVFALKHTALLGVVGIPAVSAMRSLRPRSRPKEALAPRPDADGWIRTGEAEPHRGTLRLEHDVRSMPQGTEMTARQAVATLDADKRMTLRFLSDVDAEELRAGLRARYAKRGFSETAAVDHFLSPLARPIARGETLVIAYEAATQTTRATLGETSAVIHGREFMRATWRLWFDDAVPSALADALTQNIGT